MKAKKILLAGILCLSTILAACSSDESSADPGTTAAQTTTEAATEATTEAETEALVQETTTAATTKKPPETPEEFREAAIEKSLVQLGNTYRLNKALAKMENGEETTVAYIGGSITEMFNATADNCYAKLSYDYLAQTYGTGDNVQYLNAGLSGTPSALGVLRTQRDILSYNPDIVFVEFAVNDSTSDVDKESYESLVRTVLGNENEPAVILLFMVDEKGYSAQDHMKQIGENYELPMISVPDALKPEWTEGRMTWEDYSDDYIHPHVEGHALVNEFINYYFKTLEENGSSDTSYTINNSAVFGNAYENSVLIQKNNSGDYPDDFTLISEGSFDIDASKTKLWESGWSNERVEETKEPLKFTVTASSVSIVYRRNKYDVMGTVDVYADGEKVSSVNAFNSGGFGEAQCQTVISLEEVKTMEVEIVMADGQADKMFEILGIAYSQTK